MCSKPCLGRWGCVCVWWLTFSKKAKELTHGGLRTWIPDRPGLSRYPLGYGSVMEMIEQGGVEYSTESSIRLSLQNIGGLLSVFHGQVEYSTFTSFRAPGLTVSTKDIFECPPPFWCSRTEARDGVEYSTFTSFCLKLAGLWTSRFCNGKLTKFITE